MPEASKNTASGATPEVRAGTRDGVIEPLCVGAGAGSLCLAAGAMDGDFGALCVAGKGVDLEGADFDGAELEGAELAGAELEGAELLGADFEGAVPLTVLLSLRWA